MIGRPQASFSDRVRSTTTMTEGASGSGSMRSRIEFSPSFDKLREHTRSPSRTDLTRRWSRTSEHSSINLVSREWFYFLCIIRSNKDAYRMRMIQVSKILCVWQQPHLN